LPSFGLRHVKQPESVSFKKAGDKYLLLRSLQLHLVILSAFRSQRSGHTLFLRFPGFFYAPLLEEQQTHPQKNTRHFAISAGAASSMRQVISKALQQAGSHG
jgi:hypothetical protein